jgi:hypothetical protein
MVCVLWFVVEADSRPERKHFIEFFHGYDELARQPLV